MKAIVNQDFCIGCGLCTSLAAESFRFNEEGKAEFYAESDDDSVKEAIQGCPVGAITEE